MPMTVVSGRFSPALLPIGFSMSRLLSVKYADQTRLVFVSRSARASSSVSVSVETKSSVGFRSSPTLSLSLSLLICRNRFDL